MPRYVPIKFSKIKTADGIKSLLDFEKKINRGVWKYAVS